MNLNAHTIAEINQKATHILFQQLGVVDAFKFLNQFSLGHGDYTQERKQWVDSLSLEDIMAGIQEQRNAR